ncbi:MAG: hypothetical protein KTR29_06370 [Rhodothermaceae bacterium]|nr:hypothetical protein [Rhodothermaceae bacterium]
MSTYTSLTIYERLYVSKETIAVVQNDPIIAEKLLEFGYSPDRIALGESYHADAFATTQQREDYFGNQLLATKARDELFKKLSSQFSADRRIVREVLDKDRASFQQFGLNVRLKSSRERRITQAQLFYQEVLATEFLLARLQSQFNITTDVLNQRIQQLASLEEAMQAQQVQRAEAQLMTRRRRNAMRKLDRWMGTLIAVARRALQDDPKQLEKLGIAVKNA